MLEPCAVKVARTVLRRGEDCEIFFLSDRDINKPLGISQYELTEILPKEYTSSLPSIEEIEAQFENENLKVLY